MANTVICVVFAVLVNINDRRKVRLIEWILSVHPRRVVWSTFLPPREEQIPAGSFPEEGLVIEPTHITDFQIHRLVRASVFADDQKLGALG